MPLSVSIKKQLAERIAFTTTLVILLIFSPKELVSLVSGDFSALPQFLWPRQVTRCFEQTKARMQKGHDGVEIERIDVFEPLVTAWKILDEGIEKGDLVVAGFVDIEAAANVSASIEEGLRGVGTFRTEDSDAFLSFSELYGQSGLVRIAAPMFCKYHSENSSEPYSVADMSASKREILLAATWSLGMDFKELMADVHWIATIRKRIGLLTNEG